MNILLAKTAGFCFGVDRAVKLTYDLLDNVQPPFEKECPANVIEKMQRFYQEREITQTFEKAHVSIHSMENIDTIFLSADAPLRSYLVHLLETSQTFQGKYLTLLETCNGILIYTENRNQLLILLNSLIN